MTLIDGPRLPARHGAAKQLVVFLHGYGADGNDLIGIGRQWSQLLPDAAFASPHAPEPCGMSPMGRQWFALTFRDPEERWRGVNQARPALDAFLDAELQRHGLDDSRLALVGFSQGTMMALHAGLRRRAAPAAIVGYSGVLVGEEHLKSRRRSARRCCWCTATKTRSFRLKRCSSRRRALARPKSRWSGTCPRALDTASIRKA